MPEWPGCWILRTTVFPVCVGHLTKANLSRFIVPQPNPRRGQIMPLEDRSQAIQSRHKRAEDLSIELRQKIKDKSARDYLLRPALNSLRDVETILLPNALKASPAYASMWFEMAEFQVTRAEKQLKHAEDMISKYGADVAAVE
jgi:hypothetical protein